VLSAYAPLLRVPGARQFVVGAALSRIGGAMFGVSVIVMVSSRQGSYALAGAVSAVGVFVLAVASPMLGRLVDKYGQLRASMPFILLACLGGLVTAALSWQLAPVWTLFVAYGVSAILPEVGPMSRTRWGHIYAEDPLRLHTAMAFEQVLEELSFVIGPVLGVLVSTTLFPEAGLVLAEICYTAGAIIFLLERSTEPPVTPHHERPPGLAIQRRGMLVVTSALFLIGVIFGANEVLSVAIADEAGAKGSSSLILAAFALGSAISGIWFGTRIHFKSTITQRFIVLAFLMCLLEAPVLLTSNLVWITLIMFVAGSATAPMLITSLTLTQRLVPAAMMTEGMAVAVTGILIGISAGTSLAGWLVEILGAHPAYLLPVGAGAVAAAVAYAGRRRLWHAA
jgi:MFS family permease